MKRLIIKDNSKVNKDKFCEIGNVITRIADKTLQQLAKEGIFIFPESIQDAEDITQDQMILQSANDSYCSGNVMGFLGCGNERLIIESRFSLGKHDYFFQYLLERVLNFPNIINLETDADQDDRLFNLLLFLFPYYLKSAMRKGVFKTYICSEYNNSHIRGTIDIARHITENTPFTGNVAYHQREYSYDNSLMELIRHTIEFIKRKPYGRSLIAKVKDEVKLVMDATQSYKFCNERRIISQNKQNTIRHAYYHEYRALQHLCLLILKHKKHQIGSGTHSIYGLLFDGAWLWEEYINLLIGDIFYHPMNKGRKGAQWLFAGGMGLIYPDFISRRHEKRIIADAKYKPLNHIGNKDYLQVLAYMFRFEAKEGFYFYPETDDGKDLKLWMNRGSTYEVDVRPRGDVCLIKHGLQIPYNVDCYHQFVLEMKTYEREFRKVFIHHVSDQEKQKK